MKKGLPERIAFYTRKVADRVSIHPSKKLPDRFKFRKERLALYKKLMHEQIKEAGY
jgi:hypothetical protein